MSAKAISEFAAKTILCKNIGESVTISNKLAFVSVSRSTDWSVVTANNPWLHSKVAIVTI